LTTLVFSRLQAHPEWGQRLFEPQEGALGPSAFGVVSANSDDDIIGEPMVVHRLVGSMRRLAAYRIEHPVDLIQVVVSVKGAVAQIEQFVCGAVIRWA
jgi:hypothetical protein